MNVVGADGGKVDVNCYRHWSDDTRQHYQTLSTTTTTTTTSTPLPPYTASGNTVMTLSPAARPPLDEQSHVTDDYDDKWSTVRRTLERPPLGVDYEEYKDDTKVSTKTESEEDLNTVKHYVNYGEERAEPPVYRELPDDLADDDVDDLHVNNIQEHYRHLDIPSDTVVHVHHEVHSDGMPLVDDVVAARSSATSTAAHGSDQQLSSVTQRTSSSDEQQAVSKDGLSLARGVLKYNVEEGLPTTD